MPATLPASLIRFAASLDRALHLGMQRVADMPHRRAEVGRSDEDAVHTVDRGDLGNSVDRTQCFSLHQQADLPVGLLQIGGSAAIAAGAAAGGDAANAGRRIAAGRNRAARLFSILHKRNEQGLRADIEQALDQYRIVPRRAHDDLAPCRPRKPAAAPARPAARSAHARCRATPSRSRCRRRSRQRYCCRGCTTARSATALATKRRLNAFCGVCMSLPLFK